MLTTLLLAFTTTASAAREGTLVWAGIDFGLVRMVGTGDFRDPEQIFPGYLDKWNGLFVEEQMEVLAKKAKVESVSASLSHLADLHRAADPETQIIRDDSFPFTDELPRETIIERIGSYELRATEGLALTLVADQLNKPNELGCFWVVSFDVATREVKMMEHTCEPAHGLGFRNYWFGAIKNVIKRVDVAR
ncbi:MAG: hypothetical protein H6738_11035 [Alphaproteobacteria bacterium]|nr:hypothetical protein [Alphaproteobacteria bacterium]